MRGTAAHVAWWLWMPLGAVVLWLISHGIFGGYGQAQGYVLFLQADLFPHGPLADPTSLFWIWLCVGLAGTLVIVVSVGVAFQARWPTVTTSPGARRPRL